MSIYLYWTYWRYDIFPIIQSQRRR
ncbi:putative transmembrane domain protein, partial [Chlamydia psittaci 84-8471/1]